MMHPPCPDASWPCCLHPMTSLRSGEGTIGVLLTSVPWFQMRWAQCSCHCLLKPLCKCAKILSEWKIHTHSGWNSSKSSLMTTALSICGVMELCRLTLEVVLPQFGVSDVGSVAKRTANGSVLILVPGVCFRLSLPGLLGKLWRLGDTCRELWSQPKREKTNLI